MNTIIRRQIHTQATHYTDEQVTEILNIIAQDCKPLFEKEVKELKLSAELVTREYENYQRIQCKKM